METQPIRRTNAEKRSSVELMFEALIKEFGSLDQIPKQQWSESKIADHIGVSNRMVSYIHAELLGRVPGKFSQEKPKKSELQQLTRERDEYKALMEATQEANRQLELEVRRLKAEVALLLTPTTETQEGEETSPQNKYRAILSSGQIWLSFPYDPTVLGFIKRVPGGQWEPGEKKNRLPKGWYYPLSSGEQLLIVLEEQEFDIDPEIHEAIARYEDKAEREARVKEEASLRIEREKE